MGYTTDQREVLVAAAASTASTAVVGHLCPGFFKFTLRAVAIVFTTAAGAAGNLVIKKYPVAGTSANEETVETLNYDGTIGAQGKVVYIDNLDTDFEPGQELIFEVTDVAASGVIDIYAVTEQNWEQPDNIAAMELTA